MVAEKKTNRPFFEAAIAAGRVTPEEIFDYLLDHHKQDNIYGLPWTLKGVRMSLMRSKLLDQGGKEPAKPQLDGDALKGMVSKLYMIREKLSDFDLKKLVDACTLVDSALSEARVTVAGVDFDSLFQMVKLFHPETPFSRYPETYPDPRAG